MGVIKSLFEIFIQTIPYLAVFLFGWAAVASAIQQDDLFPPLTFSIFFTISFIGSVNMMMWKLEVNEDEITWRSTFGRKRTFRFEDITHIA